MNLPKVLICRVCSVEVKGNYKGQFTISLSIVKENRQGQMVYSKIELQETDIYMLNCFKRKASKAVREQLERVKDSHERFLGGTNVDLE